MLFVKVVGEEREWAGAMVVDVRSHVYALSVVEVNERKRGVD